MKENKYASMLMCLRAMVEQPSISPDKDLEYLIRLIETIRPPRNYIKAVENSFSNLVELLQENVSFRLALRGVILKTIENKNFTVTLTDNGFPNENSFWREFWRRLKHKFLPDLLEKNSFEYVINKVFYRHYDYKWVNDINAKLWIDFFALVNLNPDAALLHKNFLQAVKILSYRMAALGIEKSVSKKIDKNKNVFLEQAGFFSNINSDNYLNIDILEQYYKIVEECRATIALARRKSLTQGVGIKESFDFFQLEKMIERIELIINVLSGKTKSSQNKLISHFRSIIENENRQNSLNAHVQNTLQLLAYRITEHERNTGEHYITTSRKEYGNMLKSATGGGFIISFIAIFKNIFHSIHAAPFWEAFLYSINYSFGFILIQITGSTLATKQPAMTASALAKSMTVGRFGGDSMAELAITVSKTIRSQFASFVGNLSIVFPLTLLLAFLFHLIFGHKLVEGADAQMLLDNQNPLRSLCLLYACFTGVFLFISGLISGYFDNKALNRKFSERIKEHPFLKRVTPAKTLNSIAHYLGKNMGLLMGNLSLGFFLGFAAFFGYIFGIPFDIRHVTIATGNFAIGLYGLGKEAITSDVIWTVSGILGIGFFNLLVSFLLAIFMALHSRGLKIKQFWRLCKYTVRLFFKYPFDFVFPPKKQRVASDFV